LTGRFQKYFPVAFSLIMFFIIGFLVYMYYPENHFALQYQAAVDCKRVQAVHNIAGLAERFYERQGYYPLANYSHASRDKQSPGSAISVIVTDKELPRSYTVNPPLEIEGKLIMPGWFEEEVSRVLGVKVKLPYDPQTNFAWEKRFYLYKVMPDGNYSVSGILFSPTEYTQKEAKHRHRYKVVSMPSKMNNGRSYKAIENEQIICEKP